MPNDIDDLANRISSKLTSGIKVEFGAQEGSLKPTNLDEIARRAKVKMQHTTRKRSESKLKIVIKPNSTKSEARIRLARKIADKAISDAARRKDEDLVGVDSKALSDKVVERLLIPLGQLNSGRVKTLTDRQISSIYRVPESMVRHVRGK
jgi:preprotein translocase subunit SecF